MQQLGQKLTLDKIHQFGTKVRDSAQTLGRKVSNTVGKISDVGLFTDKTEVTIKNVDLGEIENQIRTKLFKILGTNMAVDTSFEVIDAVEVPRTQETTEKKQ